MKTYILLFCFCLCLVVGCKPIHKVGNTATDITEKKMPVVQIEYDSAQIEHIFADCESLVKAKKYYKALHLIDSISLFEYATKFHQQEHVLQLILAIEKEQSTLNSTYIDVWHRAYVAFNNAVPIDTSRIERIWENVLESRKQKFGVESDAYISALFGKSNYYKRVGKAADYDRLKKQVEKYWQYAYVELKPEADISMIADKQAAFPGFLDGSTANQWDNTKKRFATYFHQTIRYSSSALEDTIREDVLVLEFIINDYGIVWSPKMKRVPHLELVDESVRVIQLMNELPSRWKPAIQKNEKVNQRLIFPIYFSEASKSSNYFLPGLLNN